MKDHFDRLDFELEIAIVIYRHGRNIKPTPRLAFVTSTREVWRFCIR